PTSPLSLHDALPIFANIQVAGGASAGEIGHGSPAIDQIDHLFTVEGKMLDIGVGAESRALATIPVHYDQTFTTGIEDIAVATWCHFVACLVSGRSGNALNTAPGALQFEFRARLKRRVRCGGGPAGRGGFQWRAPLCCLSGI